MRKEMEYYTGSISFFGETSMKYEKGAAAKLDLVLQLLLFVQERKRLEIILIPIRSLV
ncbi:hypothetical protein [Proteiniclasticum ruminis]|uniref:hypothetical protein n=1 Tax=Proteiniclasticum ruminis TaxID=398199 RepID=UPI0028AF8868|nr:hypothetical protein [Proteiniclasticum ruminis]